MGKEKGVGNWLQDAQGTLSQNGVREVDVEVLLLTYIHTHSLTHVLPFVPACLCFCSVTVLCFVLLLLLLYG